MAALVMTIDLNLRPLARGLVWLAGAVQNGAVWVWRQPGLWIGAWRERRAVRAAERAVARAAERDEELEEDEEEEEVVEEQVETLPEINRLPSMEPMVVEPAVVKIEPPAPKKEEKTPKTGADAGNPVAPKTVSSQD